jgi:hypothetical protein
MLAALGLGRGLAGRAILRASGAAPACAGSGGCPISRAARALAAKAVPQVAAQVSSLGSRSGQFRPAAQMLAALGRGLNGRAILRASGAAPARAGSGGCPFSRAARALATKVARMAQVSSLGRVRSATGVVNYGSLAVGGYRTVGLGGGNYYLHRLICPLFHGPPPTPAHAHVHHLDGNPSNNCSVNLAWATPSENIQASFANASRGSSAGALSKPVRGREVGSEGEWRHFPSCAAAARELGPNCNVSAAASGKRTQTGGWTFEFTPQFETIEGEQWRPVVLEDGADSGGALVSDRGRFRDTRGNIRAAPETAAGSVARRWQVQINGKYYLYHRLVCTVWHGPPLTPKLEVNHKDLDPSNNRPENLEWLTRAENLAHSRATNTDRKSSAGAQSKPVRGRTAGTEDEWRHFESASAAARELGLHKSGVLKVANGNRTQTGGMMFEWVPFEEIEGEVWKDVTAEVLRLVRY